MFEPILTNNNVLNYFEYRTPLIRTLVIRLASCSDRLGPSGIFCREFYKTSLPWNYRLSDPVQDSVVSSKASNKAWSNGSDASRQPHYRPVRTQRVLRKLSFPDFVTTAQDGGRLSALRTGHQEILLVLISVRGWVDPRAIVWSEGFYVNEKSTDTSWDRTSDLPIYSTAP